MLKRRAFTLIEVLIAVALTGLIASLALAPVVYAVRRVIDTEELYADETAMRRAAIFMVQDVNAGLRLADMVVRLIEHELLGGENDDALIVATSAPAKQNMPVGSVVYRIQKQSFMRDDFIPGLYRWVLPGVLPEAVDYEALEAKDGQLVLPYVTEMKLETYDALEWVSGHSGKIPTGLKISLSRGEEKMEYVFSFPL
jgi:prepilin-type N-terminal cleavage/methylation domain-containing protein